MAAILGPGDHLRQHNLPQMVRGDQLWRGTNCGVTDPEYQESKMMIGALQLRNNSFVPFYHCPLMIGLRLADMNIDVSLTVLSNSTNHIQLLPPQSEPQCMARSRIPGIKDDDRCLIVEK